MDEAEWVNARTMLTLLRETGRASDRKLRLFAAACCRSIWHLLTDPRSRSLLSLTEQVADGQATKEEMEEARRQHQHLYYGGGPAVTAAADADPWRAARDALGRLRGTLFRAARWEGRSSPGAILRDLFGLHPARVERAWLSPDATAIARRAYDERDFTALPVLADALEDAGCTAPDLLGHLRSNGPHYRGCWAIDLLLGKR